METANVEPSFRRRLRSLPSMAARRSAWDTLLANSSAAEAGLQIDALLRATVHGDGDASDALLALASWLILARDEGRAEAAARVRDGAEQTDLTLVALLLSDAAAFKALLPRGRLPDSNHPMRLDSLQDRAHAWVWSSAPWVRSWERSVVRVDRPEVLRHALRNRRLSEAAVLEVVARRPTTPALLREVVVRDEWLALQSVRRTLMKNPYAPTSHLLPLLPTVGAACWRELREGVAHPLVVEAADRLLASPHPAAESDDASDDPCRAEPALES